MSLCIPSGNRTHDLRRALPHTIAAANASPPVEIAILDYNSSDGLAEYIETIQGALELAEGNTLIFNRYTGREHYHLAHGYNLAVLASSGEYVAIMGADALLAPGYVAAARELIAQGCVWMRGRRFKGIVVVQREEFVDAGGYDERFEMYGAEDRDLEARLRRRGGKFGLMPDGMAGVIRTPNPDKVANYRLGLSKREMVRRAHAILDANNAAGVLVANEGREWGAWG